MKRKFFTTFAVFAALLITACGTKQNISNNDGQESSQLAEKWETNNTYHWHIGEDGKKVDNAKHEFEEDASRSVAATCSADGKKVEVCKVCGFEKETKINQLSHDWDEGRVTKEGSCSVPGEKTFTCKLCGETKVEEIKADHVWGAATPVAGAADEADYNTFVCTVCGAKKIEFAAKQASGKSVLTGSLKADDTFPDYMKLTSNGNSVEYKFNSTIAGNAKIYQRGVMDYWFDGSTNNQTRNYYAGKNSTDGNFTLDVNGAAVDYSWSKEVTYEQMLPGEAQGSYSALGDALIGDCTIVEGANTIKYTRTESYNMLIKDFVIIFNVA